LNLPSRRPCICVDETISIATLDRREQMKIRLILPLLFAALSVAVSAQTTTTYAVGGENCGPGFIYCFTLPIINTAGSISVDVYNGSKTVTIYNLGDITSGQSTNVKSSSYVAPAPIAPATSYVAYDFTGADYYTGKPYNGTVVLYFYQYYSRGGGGRGGGGGGVRTVVTSGTLFLTE
jgi:hypothetical protein